MARSVKVMAANVLGILAVTLSFLQVHGLQCLYGRSIPQPTDSGQTTTCGIHQNCYMDAMVTAGGHIRYDLGCREKLHCVKTTDRDIIVGRRSGEILICSECCTGTLCNSVGCGHSGYHVQRGPICMNCDDQLTTDDCSTITECGRDEVCMLKSIILPTTHERRFQTKCEIAELCQKELQIFLDYQTTDVACKISCCNEDLCNGNCTALSNAASTVPTTTSPSTTTSRIYHCLSNPCHRGSCSEFHDTYSCSCPDGYTGRHCDELFDTTTTTTTVPTTVALNPCLFNPCAQGTCTAIGSTFTCACYAGYTGQHCNQVATTPPETTIYSTNIRVEPTISEQKGFCQNEPCVHGMCASLQDGFVCQCANGFEGLLCNIPTSSLSTAAHVPLFTSVPLQVTTTGTVNITDCSSNPCVHGNCFPVHPNSFLCICESGFVGKVCDQIDATVASAKNASAMLTTMIPPSADQTLSTTQSTNHKCDIVPDNRFYHAIPINNSSSITISINTFTHMTQTSAVHWCSRPCTRLAHIDSEEKLNAIGNYLQHHPEYHNHVVAWVDGIWNQDSWVSSNNHSNVFHWFPTILNYHKGRCVALIFDGSKTLLEPHGCFSQHGYMCEHI